MGQPVAPRRKVLIVEDEPSIRNVLYVLLAAMGCDGDVATSGRQAISMIRRESFDAILLDLRCMNLAPKEVVAQVLEVRPRLMDRVLVITGEVSDADVLNWVEASCLPNVPRDQLVKDIAARIQTLLGLAAAPKPVV